MKSAREYLVGYSVDSYKPIGYPESLFLNISYREGEKYNLDGTPNPEFFWYEVTFEVDKVIPSDELLPVWEHVAELFSKKKAYYRSLKAKVTNG